MIDLRSNKIFFTALILSFMLHISFLYGLSGFIDFRIPGPNFFRVMFVNLDEEPILEHKVTKSTGHNHLKKFSRDNDVNETNPQEKKQDDNERVDKPKIEGDIIRAQSQEVKNTSETYADQGGFLKTSEGAQHGEAAIDREKDSKKPVKEEKDNTSHMKSVAPFVEKEPSKTVKTSAEIFYYDIFWLGILVGKASLESTHINGAVRIISQMQSAPFISSFYEVNDFAESWVIDGSPFNFRIKQHEGKYRSDKETIFDVKNKTVAYFNYLQGTENKHNIPNGLIWDVISGFYHLRTQPLEVGKPVYIDIFDSDKFYKAKVEVLKKEKIEIMNMGEIETVIVKPVLESEGLFQRRGDILIWFTDDQRKIPVKVETKVPVGSVVAELRNFTPQK